MSDYTILLIDYEPRSIEKARDPLVSAGFDVEVATDGVAGIEAFHRLKPHLVLIEAMLPKKHGFEVCHELKKTPHGKRTPILITTSVYKGRKYRTEALHVHGCDEYVEKPIADEALVGLCRRLLEQEAGSGEPAVAAGGGESVAAAAMQVEEERRPERVAATVAGIVGDLTEEEIIARLDEILPNDLAFATAIANAPAAACEDVAAHAAPVPLAVSSPPPLLETPERECAPTVEETLPAKSEPPGELGVEASEAVRAEIGESATVAEEWGDLLEALPGVESGLSEPDRAMPAEAAPFARAATAPAEPGFPIAPIEDDAPPQLTEPEGAAPEPQVLRFEPERSKSRKRRRGKRPAAGNSIQTAATHAEEHRGEEAIAAPRPEAVDMVPLPCPAPAPEAEAARPKPTPEPWREPRTAPPIRARNIPVWVWVAMAVVLGVAATLHFGRGSTIPESQDTGTPQETDQAAPPVPEVAPPIAMEAGSDRDLRASGGSVAPSKGTQRRQEERQEANGATRAESRAAQPPTLPQSPRPDAPDRTQAPPQTGVAPKDSPAVAAGPPPTTLQSAPPPSDEILAAETDAPANGAGAEAAPITAPPTPAVELTPTAALGVEPGSVVPYGELDSPLAAVSRPLPAYTARARLMRERGEVMMNLLVEPNGSVSEVQLIQGIDNSDLTGEAIRTAGRWTFTPPRKGGVPVRTWKFEKVRFQP